MFEECIVTNNMFINKTNQKGSFEIYFFMFNKLMWGCVFRNLDILHVLDRAVGSVVAPGCCLCHVLFADRGVLQEAWVGVEGA